MKLIRKSKSGLDYEIDSLLRKMRKMDCTSEQYKKAAMNVELLCKARSYEKKNVLDKNVVLSSAVNLTGIGMILRHEQLNVITTKALSFVSKIR